MHLKKIYTLMKEAMEIVPNFRFLKLGFLGKTSAVVGESQQLFDRQIKDPPHTLDAIYYARPMRQAPSELCFFCISRTVMFSSFR